MPRQLDITPRNWPTRGTFRISRSALSVIPTVQVRITEGGASGRAECRPYARYDQTVDSVVSEIESVRAAVQGGLSRDALQDAMGPGSARNALDCALWDLEAKQTGLSVSQRLGLRAPQPRQTAFTLSVDTPANMADAARAASAHHLLKVKLGGADVLDSLAAIQAARPDAELIVDANEAFDATTYPALHAALAEFPIRMVEQPLPAGHDDALPRGGPPICADESLHTAEDLPRLKAAGYRAVNVKLDKCGGLSAAATLMRRARELDMAVMAGCMVGSSLAMAPMMVLESLADVIDLDGPLLLSADEPDGLRYADGRVHPPSRALWG